MSSARKQLQGPGVLTYRLRVSRHRRTVGLSVTDSGELVVHAPRGLPEKAIDQAIDKNQAWIAKKQAERREAWALITPGKVYYRGEALALRLVHGGTAEVHLDAEAMLVQAETLSEDLWPRLQAWYQGEAKTVLTGRVKDFAGRLGLPMPPVEVRDWRRRWGDCQAGGFLRFNWRLILLPPEILDYVVVHELAHLVVPGHPPRFWQKMGEYLPDYTHRRHWLKRYGGPFLHWRLIQD